MVIVTRNVDLSVGSIVGLTTYFAGWLFANVHGIPIVVVVAAALVAGGLLGLVNGVLVAFLEVPSLVITLGTLYAYRGIAVLWIGGDFIRPSWLPADFKRLGTKQILSIPALLIVARKNAPRATPQIVPDPPTIATPPTTAAATACSS
jgi:rhamnose transport system permease protein